MKGKFGAEQLEHPCFSVSLPTGWGVANRVPMKAISSCSIDTCGACISIYWSNGGKSNAYLQGALAERRDTAEIERLDPSNDTLWLWKAHQWQVSPSMVVGFGTKWGLGESGDSHCGGALSRPYGAKSFASLNAGKNMVGLA